MLLEQFYSNDKAKKTLVNFLTDGRFPHTILLEGEDGDDFGIAGFYVPPMYREGLSGAMERMCSSRVLRETMGQIGRDRVNAYYRHGRMLDDYRRLYADTADQFGLER